MGAHQAHVVVVDHLDREDRARLDARYLLSAAMPRSTDRGQSVGATRVVAICQVVVVSGRYAQ